MKKQLLKKISACLPVGMAIIVTVMMFSVCANAQIVYTDINPDIVKNIGNGVLDSIDINNDGVFDLQFLGSRNYSPGGLTNPPFPPPTCNVILYVDLLHGSEIIRNSSGYPLKMNLNDVINSSGSWSNIAGQILGTFDINSSASPLGNWMLNSATDGYLGLKIISGSQTNYCWVRLNNVYTPNRVCIYKITIKDFAYNSISNQPILAGQTTATGIIENSFASSINLFPNPADNHLTIDLGSNNQKVEVTITDITGKIIYSTTARETQKIEVDMKDFKAGIYVVQIQSADFIATKKLVVGK